MSVFFSAENSISIWFMMMLIFVARVFRAASWRQVYLHLLLNGYKLHRADERKCIYASRHQNIHTQFIISIVFLFNTQVLRSRRKLLPKLFNITYSFHFRNGQLFSGLLSVVVVFVVWSSSAVFYHIWTSIIKCVFPSLIASFCIGSSISSTLLRCS